MSDSQALVCDKRGPVLIARLNRPEARNALNPEMMRGIGAAIVDAETDPDIRVVVLTGAGDRSFCAGIDLRADRIAANGPIAVAAVKELVRLGVTDEARARERLGELQSVVFGSEDAKEGALAFIEKRPPVWQGR